MIIRTAHPSEAETLSRIAQLAKAHWGYAAADLARWKADLTFSPASINRWPTAVAEIEEEIVGVCQLTFVDNQATVEHLWVLPSQMSRGVGRGLLEWAKTAVSQRGLTRLIIDSDPHAAGFYEACGAVRIGETRAPLDGQPNRIRPLLQLLIPTDEER